MKRCRPNESVREIYEHVGGILKHNISLKLIKMKLYLSLFKLTQLKEYSRILKTTNLLNSEVLKDKILNSQRLDIKLKIRY